MLIKTLVFTLIFSLGAGKIYATELPVLTGIGGNFNAVNHHGEEIKLKLYSGNIVLLAFGYTSCADVCPFTLGYLDRVYQTLNNIQKDKTKVVFVSIDPEYDTPRHLKEFISYFNKSFIGLTGTIDQINKIASSYKVKYQKLSEQVLPSSFIRRVNEKNTGDKKDYVSLYNHSINIYLIDKNGDTRGIAYTGTPVEELSQNIQKLLNE